MEQISPYISGVLLAYSAFLLAIVSPGPNMLAVIGTSMSAGRKSGIALAVGISVGSFTWAMLTALGLSAILATYASALLIIKLFGGLYLLWLAYKSFRSALTTQDIEANALSQEKLSLFAYARRGFIVQMTNPKAALSWIAIIALGLAPGAPAWVGTTIVLGTFLLALLIYNLYALAFSAQVVVRFYAKARRAIQATIGLFFAFAGLKLLSSRS